MFLLYLFVGILAVGCLTCLEVIPERPQVDYYNPKYISSLKLVIGRKNRGSPHYIDLDVTTTVGFGDNLTLHMASLEFLSGRYQPTPLQGTYKLCDFLYHEPYLGQMYAKQIKGNWTCPFPPGAYSIHNLVIHMENFPFNIPFTWAQTSVSVTTRVDIKGYFTLKKGKETVFIVNTHAIIIQKPK